MSGTSLPGTSRLTNEASSHVSDAATSARPTFRLLIVYIDNYYCFPISNGEKKNVTLFFLQRIEAKTAKNKNKFWTKRQKNVVRQSRSHIEKN